MFEACSELLLAPFNQTTNEVNAVSISIEIMSIQKKNNAATSMESLFLGL